LSWINDLIGEKPKPVCQKGDFVFAVIGLDHGHINSMCTGLIEAGAELKWVYDKDPKKVKSFLKRFPDVRVADSPEAILEDPSVHLVATAIIPAERYQLGLQTMEHQKDFFTAKTPFTTLEQVELVREKIRETKQMYAVYYSERLKEDSHIFAGRAIDDGRIGQVIQVLGMGPHRLAPETRPDWFFDTTLAGGILCDIGSHQIDQFLYYTNNLDAKVQASKVANYHYQKYKGFEDFGDATLIGDNGATHYFRVDWLSPSRLRTGGDTRTFILGTKGYIEIRKNIDVAREKKGNQLYIVDQTGEYHLSLKGKVGTPYFGHLILDCLHRTEHAMSQAHALKASELSLIAQNQAVKIKN